METQTLRVFPPFRLDLNSEQLWRDEQAIALRPKTFAVLRHLVEHPGKLVTKDELLDTVWAGTIVSDTVLKSCIRELREALGDDAQTPQYIATVHRRGYRFIAALSTTPLQGSGIRGRSESPGMKSHAGLSMQCLLRTPSSVLVGREPELAQLHVWLERALHGKRQVVFITGEAGIGKTTLVDAFLQTLASSPQHPTPFFWLGRGQCIEQYGAGEAYMPILEALGRLCREPGGEHLIVLLNQHAPTWLVQMPTLLNATELGVLQRKVQGATRERMLREMAEAIDAITAERPLILWLEDLHWSDVSTLELLALLARRREPARLLVIGTYRPVDVIVTEHPLRAMKQELQLHGQCEELVVRLLTEEAVEEYLGMRVSAEIEAQHAAPLQDLAHAVHQRTEGNPLFMVNVVKELLDQGKIDNTAVEIRTPATIRQMIEQRFERLSTEEQKVLEVASVAGVEFSAAVVAAGGGATIDDVEQRCTSLARRGHFLQVKGTADWPDGTIATRYGFLHALYQEVMYERVPVGQRVNLHQRIGERREAGYSTQVNEIAAELAVHFERGRNYQRAVQYLEQAGQNAIRRSAYQEAIAHFNKELVLLRSLPDTPERTQQEIGLQVTLGFVLMASKGWAAPEVETAYLRARELCQQLGETPQLFWVLSGLCSFYHQRAELQAAREIAEQCLRLAQSMQLNVTLILSDLMLGATLRSMGELSLARKHLEQGITLYDPEQHRGIQSSLQDLGVGCLSNVAQVLWLLGYPDQALNRINDALTLARDISHSFSLAYALLSAGFLHQCRREGPAAKAQAEEVLRGANDQGFAQLAAAGQMLYGWALSQQDKPEEGVVQMQQDLAAYRATGSELNVPSNLSLLAEACGAAGQVEEGLIFLAEALERVDRTGERVYEAELYRLKGELTLQKGAGDWGLRARDQANQRAGSQKQKLKISNTQPPAPNTPAEAEAEACFFKAIHIARRQQAKSWELRTTMSLARLWQRQGKQKEAHKLLAEIYGWFTEGFDTKDLQEAKALLEKLE